MIYEKSENIHLEKQRNANYLGFQGLRPSGHSLGLRPCLLILHDIQFTPLVLPLPAK